MVLRSAWASTANWLLLQRATLQCRTSSLGEGFSLQLYIDSCRTRGLEFGKVSKPEFLYSTRCDPPLCESSYYQRLPFYYNTLT